MSEADFVDQEQERTWDGCEGDIVDYDNLDDFLSEALTSCLEERELGDEVSAVCVWGHAGIGKTAKIKQLAKAPVEWRGEKYDGWEVVDVPIAQMEEMGDLHGTPDPHVYMRNGSPDSGKFVHMDLSADYLKNGWSIDPSQETKMLYSPPDWVPSEAKPTIVLFDDWNRTSLRIVKGCMQLFQNYRMVSWSLPPGCVIVMTANPAGQDFLVTELDEAIISRLSHVTLKEDATQWAVWAQGVGLDERGINFVLRYPEMMYGGRRTNPRTLARLFRWTKGKSVDTTDEAARFMRMAKSHVDDSVAVSMMTFFTRDVELVVPPEDILTNHKRPFDRVQSLMVADESGEKRIDILGIVCGRMYAHLAQPNTKPAKESEYLKQRENFHRFITMSCIEEDARHNLCMRLNARRKERPDISAWLLGSQRLSQMLVELL